jgi:enolase
MYTIQHLHARELLDSRGNPTIEVELSLINALWISWYWSAMVPSGASTGTHEALELRDGDASRFLGKGVLKAVSNVNTSIKKEVMGMSFEDIWSFDGFLLSLDGTPNKSKLGANAMLACSMACMVAIADAEKVDLYEMIREQALLSDFWSQHSELFTLPIPLMNIINGGAHADNALDFQELMIIPEGATSLHEAVRMGAEVFHHLKKILKKSGYATSVGDEGGYAPNVQSNREALDMILQAIAAAGYTTDQIKIGLDVASTEFYKDGLYCFEWDKQLSSEQMAQYYLDLIKEYPIVSIEDGFAEDDFAGWSLFQKSLEDTGLAHIRTVGDDLYVTNVERLQMGIDQQMSNSILIKLNQIGTVSETIACVQLAHQHGMHSIISHRSGETEDHFIADLSVALWSKYIKTGSLSRSDRIAKYNQLMRIEEKLLNH